MFDKPADVHSVANAIGESASSRSIWSIVNQLSKYNFSCGSVIIGLKETQGFLIK